MTGTNGNVLYSVVARGANDVWVVGQRVDDAPPDDALIEQWDGRRWSAVVASVAAARPHN